MIFSSKVVFPEPERPMMDITGIDADDFIFFSLHVGFPYYKVGARGVMGETQGLV